MGLLDFFVRKSIRKPVVKVIRSQSTRTKVVKPDNTPLCIQRGWALRKNTYHGYYRTKYGAWQGEIVRRGDKFNVYIHNPPLERIKSHSRWPCFHEGKNGKWRIHLAKNPKDGDISAIIFYVERIILESFTK